jgi:hypothetical protein
MENPDSLRPLIPVTSSDQIVAALCAMRAVAEAGRDARAVDQAAIEG